MLLIAKIGKTIGLKGNLKLHIFSDFHEIFKNGTTLSTLNEDILIENFDQNKNIVKFKNIDNIDSAKKLVNRELFMSKDDTVKQCKLGNDEYFWFDIIGSTIIDNDQILGTIVDIERMSKTDYFIVKTTKKLTNKYSEKFLVPYIDRYVDSVNCDKKIIYTKDVIDILEQS